MPKDRLDKLRTKVFIDFLAELAGSDARTVRERLKKAGIKSFAEYLQGIETLVRRLMREQNFPFGRALTEGSLQVLAIILGMEPNNLAQAFLDRRIRQMEDLSTRVLHDASALYAEKYETGPIEAARPTAQRTYEALMFDLWPDSPAAISDFWLTDQKHYEALYYPVRAAEITVEDLDRVLGDAEAITELVNAMPSNPHKGIVFGEPLESWQPTRN